MRTKETVHLGAEMGSEAAWMDFGNRQSPGAAGAENRGQESKYRASGENGRVTFRLDAASHSTSRLVAGLGLPGDSVPVTHYPRGGEMGLSTENNLTICQLSGKLELLSGQCVCQIGGSAPVCCGLSPSTGLAYI